MNCSMAAELAPSGVDVYTALAGAAGLYGPVRGDVKKAFPKMLYEIGSIDYLPDFIESVKNRKRKMSSFGHTVYTSYNPSAKVTRKLAEEVFVVVRCIEVALSKAADEYFIKKKMCPEANIYSQLKERAMLYASENFTLPWCLAHLDDHNR